MSRQLALATLGLLLTGPLGLWGAASAQVAPKAAASPAGAPATIPGEEATNRPPAEAASPAKQPAAPGAATKSARTIFKQDADGRWKPVPLDAAAFDEPEPASREMSSLDPQVPDAFLSQLRIDGAATDVGVELTADVTVKVVTPDRWLRIPLRFDQALLIGVEHTGTGEAAPDLAHPENQGISWLLKGQGEHRLRLSLRVPLRKTPEGERLQLQLPELGLFTGEMELRIPSSAVTVREGNGVRLRGTKTDGNATIVSADLTGERLDLRWNVVLQPTETMTLEPTEITLKLAEELFELTAHQEVQLQTGQLDALRVRLPSDDFELSPQGVRVSDRSGHERWVQPSPPDESSWVTVPVDGVVGNIVELDWRFAYQPSGSADEIVIDGFEVAETRKHTGTITVVGSPGYRVSRVEEGEIGIKRIDVSEQSAALAYAFSGGRSRLTLRVEPIVPSLSVTPYYFLLISPDRVELQAVFQIHVDDGSFRSVPIRLQEEEGKPWVVNASPSTAGELRPISADGNGEEESDKEAGHHVARQWVFQLPEAVDRQTTVSLSAAYFFGLYGSQETPSFSLPTIAGARTFPGSVIVSTADNVEVTTRAQAGTTLIRQDGSALRGRPITLPEWMSTQPQTVYRLTTADSASAPSLETEVTVRSRQITTSANVNLSTLESNLSVTQRIAYNVKYGRLSRIRLQIPPALGELIPEEIRPQSLQFLLNGDKPLEAEWSGRDVSLDLPTPILGEFEIVVAGYFVGRNPVPEQQTLHVPIIRSLDQPFEMVRLSVPGQETTEITVTDDAWTRLATVIGGPQWITRQSVEGVSIAVNRSLARSPLRLTISEALLQTELDEVGNSSTTATYLMKLPPTRLVVQLPDDVQNPQFDWNGIPFPDGAVVEEPQFPHQFRLAPPTDGPAPESADLRLTIRYRQPRPEARWSEGRSVAFPKFPNGVWIEQTWWELSLPNSQHLFVSPQTMTPQFQWQREQIFWSRRPNAGFEAVRNTILPNSFAEPSSSNGAANVYAFKSFVSPEEVRFRSMSKSMIVFLGAGLTLTLSFLLVKVPAARHPSLWLGVGLVFTAASLWYLEPMLLLLQPAAYGLVLPLCAALLEYATDGGLSSQRRRISPSGLSRPDVRGTPMDSGSAYAPVGMVEPPLATTHVRPTAISDSGIKP